MSTYKALIGKYVRSVSSDPTAAYAEGELWYNTTSNTFKTAVSVFAWASGGAVGTARTTAGAGTQTANVIMGGQGPTSNVEEYNGSSWSEVNNMPYVASNLSGTGIQTAAMAFGGYPNVTTTALYDGTNWTTRGS